ncbi:hypothetical protein BH23CHL5_BH23CHL5_27120 [soil metagenome]
MRVMAHGYSKLHANGKSTSKQRMLWSALMCLLFVVSLSFETSSKAVAVSDADSAMEMAYYLSYLESVGDFNTEYDFIHPDAREIVPRAAVVGWFLDNYSPKNPQPATITGVEFISWTWDVTGITYPFTAQVSFTQGFRDGTRNDVVRLVQDQNGVWRWFFGRNREFVDEVIARYAPLPTTIAYTGYVNIDLAMTAVDFYWNDFFRAEPTAYEPPKVLTFDQATRTGCGIVDPLTHGPLYCTLDETIYLNALWLVYVANTYHPLVVPIVIAHEYGHHVQSVLRLPNLPGAGYELQADCLSGAWARDYATQYGVSESELVASMALMIDIGGGPDHGPGTQRAKEFLTGFYDGSQACF